MHYLDYAATTPVSNNVQQAILQEMAYFGNPSSTYRIGRTQKQKIETVKTQLLQTLGTKKPDAIVFTGSGSEANNLVFASITQHFATERGHLIVSSIEHPSVRKSAQFAETLGFEVTYLNPDATGVITVEQVAQALRPDTRLVSVMTVNNETGVRQPIEAIGALLAKTPTYFHTDAVQAFAQETIDVTAAHIDYLTASGHKLHAPKGIGFLFKSHVAPIHSLVKGGGQEQGWRAGTENVPYIVGLSTAVTDAVATMADKREHYEKLTQYLLEQLEQHAIMYEVNGTASDKSPHICNLWLKGIPSSRTLILCDLKDVAISAGSACSAGSLEPSPVLTAMFPGQSHRVAESIRLSFGLETSMEDIDAFVSVIASIKS